jgi:hypothetical protein
LSFLLNLKRYSMICSTAAHGLLLDRRVARFDVRRIAQQTATNPYYDEPRARQHAQAPPPARRRNWTQHAQQQTTAMLMSCGVSSAIVTPHAR